MHTQQHHSYLLQIRVRVRVHVWMRTNVLYLVILALRITYQLFWCTVHFIFHFQFYAYCCKFVCKLNQPLNLMNVGRGVHAETKCTKAKRNYGFTFLVVMVVGIYSTTLILMRWLRVELICECRCQSQSHGSRGNTFECMRKKNPAQERKP